MMESEISGNRPKITFGLCFPHINIAGIHLYAECKRSNTLIVCHKILSTLWPHEQVCSQTTNLQVSQCEATKDISEQFVSKLQTILLTTHFPPFSIDGHPCMMFRFCLIVELFYSQVRNIFPHISLRDLPCHETKKILFLHQVSLKLW